MRNSLFNFLLLPLIAACNTAPKANYQLRDSALARHFDVLRKLPFYDTTVIDYKLLKAAYLNDTNYFLSYFKEMPEEEQSFQLSLLGDSCLHLPQLSRMGVDEAYRFNYECGMFSEIVDGYATNISSVTITRKDKDIRMQVIRAEYLPIDSNSWQHVKTIVHYRQDSTLTFAEWDSLQKEIRYADYWGLKPSNDFRGKDGYSITVDGFIKGDEYDGPKSHHVYRWAPDQFAIYRPYRLAMKLTGLWNQYYRYYR